MLTGNFEVYESVSAAVFQQALLDFPFTAGGSDWNDVKQGERRCLRLAYGKPDKIALGWNHKFQMKPVLKSIPKGKSIIEWEEESTSYA